MSWSFKLGRIFGIDIKVHLTFALILIWGALNYGGSAGPLYGLIVTLALFSLVLLHELGHSLAAIGYGIPVRDITLLPIGGLARLERMPEKPLHELVVALAGPAVNVVLALILLPVIMFLGLAQGVSFSLAMLQQPGLLNLLVFLLSANIMLAVFNMIPAFPLDGGRVFRAILGFFMEYQQATQIATVIGRFLAVGLGLIGLFSGQFLLAFVALFIFVAGGQENQVVAARSILRKVQAAQALGRQTIALSPSTTVGQVATMMMGSRQPDFAVLDPLNGQLLGITTSKGVAQAMQQGRWHSRITDVMQHARHIPKVALDATLDEVQEKIARSSGSIAAVYDGLYFRGLIHLDDIYRVFRFVSRQGPAARRIGWEAS